MRLGGSRLGAVSHLMTQEHRGGSTKERGESIKVQQIPVEERSPGCSYFYYLPPIVLPNSVCYCLACATRARDY